MRVMTECEEQEMLMQVIEVHKGRCPELEMLFHVPNEGKRTRYAGGKLKKEGMKTGVPDLFLDVPKGRYHGLRIELKRQKGNKATEDQRQWIIKYISHGYAAAVCYGWEEAWQLIRAYVSENQKMINNYIDRTMKEIKEAWQNAVKKIN